MANTANFNLPLIDGSMTADVPRDMNALAEAVDSNVRAAIDGAVVTVPDASTARKGIVQLTNATDSTSETLAPTAKALKAAYDRADQAFQSGNERKAEVVAALVAKGIPASTSESWDSLISKISAIIRATGNAMPADVLAGKTFSNEFGNNLTGTMFPSSLPPATEMAKYLNKDLGTSGIAGMNAEGLWRKTDLSGNYRLELLGPDATPTGTYWPNSEGNGTSASSSINITRNLMVKLSTDGRTFSLYDRGGNLVTSFYSSESFIISRTMFLLKLGDFYVGYHLDGTGSAESGTIMSFTQSGQRISAHSGASFGGSYNRLRNVMVAEDAKYFYIQGKSDWTYALNKSSGVLDWFVFRYAINTEFV
ncbi:phage tail protein [Paenibacillus macerans]|uniref:phage tail protein n=1 Tax=Paenibacillus macerans TaxID=44252 RepID=UPI002DB871F8|nr:phage tail protein [Paenibacillus macerans]MEC0328669.1 phage tail protein [Paenibacillus macerans]